MQGSPDSQSTYSKCMSCCLLRRILPCLTARLITDLGRFYGDGWVITRVVLGLLRRGQTLGRGPATQLRQQPGVLRQRPRRVPSTRNAARNPSPYAANGPAAGPLDRVAMTHSTLIEPKGTSMIKAAVMPS